MKLVFVDTNYLVALLQESDQWHERAISAEREIENSRYVTTDSVLCELLNHFSKYGSGTRSSVAAAVHDILAHPDFQVLEQNRTAFYRV